MISALPWRLRTLRVTNSGSARTAGAAWLTLTALPSPLELAMAVKRNGRSTWAKPLGEPESLPGNYWRRDESEEARKDGRKRRHERKGLERKRMEQIGKARKEKARKWKERKGNKREGKQKEERERKGKERKEKER